MLHEFLAAHRASILSLTRGKTDDISQSKPTSAQLEQGLPEFYDHLVKVLKEQAAGGGKAEAYSAPSTTRHGKESMRLGYTLSQVVHGYGVICQAITETAQETGAEITPGEFSTLNLSLDVAIAEAVTGFAESSREADTLDPTRRIGLLVHELRNCLACALVAHSLVKSGTVGSAGRTNAVLEKNLRRMQSDPRAYRRPMLLIEAVEEVEITADEEARLRGLTLSVAVDPRLQVEVDRNYLVSALANIVQNAIKFSERGGTISLRAVEGEKTVALEIEDRCGGLPKGKLDELRRPFTQKNGDPAGLGLAISRRAIALNGGTLSVRDLPGQGCVFSITLPKPAETAPSRTNGSAAA